MALKMRFVVDIAGMIKDLGMLVGSIDHGHGYCKLANDGNFGRNGGHATCNCESCDATFRVAVLELTDGVANCSGCHHASNAVTDRLPNTYSASSFGSRRSHFWRRSYSLSGRHSRLCGWRCWYW